MAHRNRQKGNYHERKIEAWLTSIGIEAERQPLSGSLGGKYRGDIVAEVCGHRLVIEVKYRDKSKIPNPFNIIEDRDLAVVKRRYGSPQTLVVMTDETFEKLFGNTEGQDNGDQD